MENPWTHFRETHAAGTVIEGEVRNITEFGLFIGLDGDVDGMVHLSDIDWSKPGEEAIKDYAKGQMVKAVVLDVDIEKERISLGIKQLSKSAETGTQQAPAAGGSVKKGDVITVTVVAVNDGGIEVELDDGTKSFVRRADLSRDRSEQRPERFSAGEKVDVKVTNVDKAKRQVALSIKAREIAEEKEAVAQYGSSDSGASLGDILGAALSKAQKKQDGDA